MTAEQKLLNKLLEKGSYLRHMNSKQIASRFKLDLDTVYRIRNEAKQIYSGKQDLVKPVDTLLRTKVTKIKTADKETETRVEYYDQNLEVDKENLIEFINNNFKPRFKHQFKQQSGPVKYTKKDLLYEINLSDFHFGKASYDDKASLESDITKWNYHVNKAMLKIDKNRADRVVFILGNDLFHIDNGNKSTTKGTPQDVTSSYEHLITKVTETIINTINKMSMFCPIDVICIRGNHDSYSVVWLNQLLKLFYSDSPVNIISDNNYRQYYRWKSCAFMYVHGDKSNLKDLALAFATEGGKTFEGAKFRNIRLGHLHRDMRMEIQTIRIDYLPSLANKDNYHNHNNYNSIQQAKVTWFDETGYLGEECLR
jgi:hypothetical protein